MPKYNAWIQKYKYKTHTQDFAPCTPCPPEGECTYKILFRQDQKNTFQDQETLKKIFLPNFSQIERGVANGEPGVQADISVRTVNISDTFSLKRCTNGDRHP